MNLLEEAIIYSTIMYQGKKRKINNTPFILHPLEVSQIISTMTDDMEIIAAGVLHDVVEDTDGSLKEIKKRFGERVAMLVESETEIQYPHEDKKATWKKRKEQSLEMLRKSKDIGVKMLWLADKLSNMRSLARSYSEMGEKVWEHLHQNDPSNQRWYYKTVAEYVEMELNKTGSYKEYIDRINYIWPGTFDSSKTKYKEYRTISVDDCKQIGRGAKGDVYRYNDELIVKVYNEKNTYKDVEREISLARSAFVMGLPTAISFGIVSVGKGYGAMFELINAKTVSELIAKNPEHVDYYAEVMAKLARHIHSTKAADKKLVLDANDVLISWAMRGLWEEDAHLAQKLIDAINRLPPVDNLAHGDFHTGNVFLSDREPIFIDVDRMAAGTPFLDISGIYLFYVGYAEVDPKMIEDFMGFSVTTAKRFYDNFMKCYLNTQDEKEITEISRKAELLADVRLIGQIKKKAVLSDNNKKLKARLLNRVRDLMQEINYL